MTTETTSTISLNVTSKKVIPLIKKKVKKKETFDFQVLSHIMASMKPFNLKTLAFELRTTEIALNNLMLSHLDKGSIVKKEFTGGKRTKEMYWPNLEKAHACLEKMRNEPRSGSHPEIVDENTLRTARFEFDRLASKLAGTQREISVIESEKSLPDIERALKEEEELMANLRTKVCDMKNSVSSNSIKTTVARGVGQAVGLKVGSGNLSSRFSQGRSALLSKNRNYGGINKIMHSSSSSLSSSSRQLKIRINSMRDEWKQRKDLCTDFIDNLSDAMEKRTKDILKLLDVETDEIALGENNKSTKVKIPPKHVIE